MGSFKRWIAAVLGLNHVDPAILVDLERRVYTLGALADERARQVQELQADRNAHIADHRKFADWMATSVMGRLPVHDDAKALEMIRARTSAVRDPNAETPNHRGGFQLKRRTNAEAMGKFLKEYDLSPANLHTRREPQEVNGAADPTTTG